MERSLVCLSGGVDSTTLVYHVRKEPLSSGEVCCVGFNYGQKNDRELEYAEKIASNLGLEFNILKIDFSQLHSSSPLVSRGRIPKQKENKRYLTIVPGRNIIFLSFALALALTKNIDCIFYGANKTDAEFYSDCKPNFVFPLDEAIYNSYGIRIFAPFINWSKIDILRWGIEHRVPYEKTYTCYSGNDEPCMECDACVERLEAFEKLGRDYYGQKI